MVGWSCDAENKRKPGDSGKPFPRSGSHRVALLSTPSDFETRRPRVCAAGFLCPPSSSSSSSPPLPQQHVACFDAPVAASAASPISTEASPRLPTAHGANAMNALGSTRSSRYAYLRRCRFSFIEAATCKTNFDDRYHTALAESACQIQTKTFFGSLRSFRREIYCRYWTTQCRQRLVP